MTDIKEQVGQLIRETRKAKGLTQKELGEKMGVSESAVNRYENGKVNASIDAIQRIATELGARLEIKIIID